MGEVYRARDTKLNRDVAIKVLLPAVANDPDRLARFSREAQVLASLNHPNIAAIYGIEETSGVTALVMELVEGEDLSNRISRGAIPIDEALPIARQIAEALEAAHDHGIIHRDLKPANVKVRPDGTVKVLDFGLAKSIDPSAGSSVAAMNSPTLSLQGTQAGIILGTAAYMAPEQAKGKSVDKRADVWAFGVVLYEMLTGAKAFPGEDISDTLATLLKFEPDWTLLPGDTPLSIRRLLKRCLMKDPKLRLRECGSAIVEIDEAGSGESNVAVTDARTSGAAKGRWLLPAMAVALMATAAVAAWSLWERRVVDGPQRTRRFTITLPDSQVLSPASGTLLAVSPDGRTLVYRVGHSNGTSQLFRRPLDQFDAAAIPATDNGREPLFFSPDGQWLGFGADQTLRKIALIGGPMQTLVATVTGRRGATWSADGLIIFGEDNAGSRLQSVPAAGGVPTPVSKAQGSDRAWYPQLLPGGKKVLFTLSANLPDKGSLYVLDLTSGDQRSILPNAAAGRVLASGHLVFVRSASLWAVPFNLDRNEPVGEPAPVVEGIRVEGGGAVQYSVSDEGTLAYIPGTASGNASRTLMFLNNDGRATPLTVPPQGYEDIALSPEQTRIAAVIGSGDDADVWVAEIARGTLTRVTSEAGFDGNALWTNDGTSLVFASARGSRWTLQRKAADGTGAVTVLATFENAGYVAPLSWSPDGATLLVAANDDVLSLTANTKGQPAVLLKNATGAAISPDGRWVAYSSAEGGRPEVYLQRFPALGDRRIVSTSGTRGYSPTWSHDGGELFYLRGVSAGPPNALMRVTVGAAADGRIEIGTPEVMRQFEYYNRAGAYRPYDVTRDRQRVLVIGRNAFTDDSSMHRINVVVNWFDELKRLMPIE